MGGGTTAIACLNSERKFKGCEVSKKYCDQIEKIIKDKGAIIDSKPSDTSSDLVNETKMIEVNAPPPPELKYSQLSKDLTAKIGKDEKKTMVFFYTT